MKIGVLALQGGFAEHSRALDTLGIPNFEIRKATDLNKGPDGLIIPGGESTVMGRLLHETGLFFPLKKMIDTGLPVFGTCAGMILLAKQITHEPKPYFCSMDISVKRNAFGRQMGSFHTTGEFLEIGDIPMTFIRAPIIEMEGPDIQILASVDGNKVAARNKTMLVTAFHPELTANLQVLQYFLAKVV